MLYFVRVIVMDKVLVNCVRLDDFGRGIGYVLGKIIFVPNLLPNEEALVKIVLNKKKYMVGEIGEIIKKSDDRIETRCPYEKCGCALKSLNYEKTLEFKKNKVINILKRYGNLENVVREIIPSANIYNYRNKITLKVRDGKIGYFKNETNELIEINRCEIASEKSNKIIKILNENDLSKVSEVTIKDFGEVMVIIKGNMNISKLKPLVDSIYMNDELVYGRENIIASLGDFKFYVSKEAFFQVNMDVALKVYLKVLNYLDDGKKVLDLYCGTGTISLFLSKYFDEVLGIEINEEAVRCANLNKKLNNISNAEFICGDASKEIHHLKFQADSIVIDPPRSGLSLDGINDILNIALQRLVYVSCDPMTLARDLKILKSNYEVKEVTLFDMFPLTYHVESVVKLEKKIN